VLAIALINSTENYSVLESIVNALGAGIGYTLVIIMMSGIREKLDLADSPKSMRGLPVAFLVAALLALAFVGFNGIV
jgi:electron transport complex protein RnfA